MNSNIFWLCFISDGFESSYTICNNKEDLNKKKSSFILSIKDKIESSIKSYDKFNEQPDPILMEVMDYIENKHIDSDLVPDTFMDVYELSDDIIKYCLQDEGYDIKDYKRNRKYIDMALYDCGLYEFSSFTILKVETISAIKEILDNDKKIYAKINSFFTKER